MRIAAEEARALARTLLERAGAPVAHATLQADVLLEGELRGHPSHGLQRLPRLLNRIERGLADPAATGAQSWRKAGLLEVDGNAGLGPVVATRAIDALLSRVGQTGVAVAAVRNANHLGMLAGYVERIAAAGSVGIALSTSEALVHPHGGTRAMLGTNPIAVAVPTAGAPFVLDLATSVVSMGKIHDHALRGATIPQGWALDANGDPTTDAIQAKSGAIAPFGGAKGYALGLAFELLVGALAGSPFAPDVRGTLDAEHKANKGDVFIVIEPNGAPELAERISAYLDALRSSRPADPSRPVTVPGDGARARREAALQGGIEIPDQLWRDLQSRLSKDIQS
ncbi:Ldh family oxidoreductase [Devosia albogilva]|uniref:Ldh family oxidoreductase n=1 Tax=Devosia albogilva TaxID=429726 RepID=A0ABW5QEK1_9HYPH